LPLSLSSIHSVFLSCKSGTGAEPYIKHLDGEIWELRPTRDRILFAAWDGSGFVLLHHFMKKTQKTPKREIERAIKNMIDFVERSDDDEQE
jgi:phage-related protein